MADASTLLITRRDVLKGGAALSLLIPGDAHGRELAPRPSGRGRPRAQQPEARQRERASSDEWLLLSQRPLPEPQVREPSWVHTVGRTGGEGHAELSWLTLVLPLAAYLLPVVRFPRVRMAHHGRSVPPQQSSRLPLSHERHGC